MKIFALYTNFELSHRHEWFDEFLKKFGYEYNLHITLIQPRYIQEEQIDGLKIKVAKFLEKNRLDKFSKEISFEKIIIDKEDDGLYTFMLPFIPFSSIMLFQKKLTELLKEYDNYVQEKNRNYELNFKPHITVAINVEESKLLVAQSYFTPTFNVSGTITKLVLPIVKDTSIEEANDQENLTTFNI